MTFLVNFWDQKPEPPNCVPFPYGAMRAEGVRVEKKNTNQYNLDKDDTKENRDAPAHVPTVSVDMSKKSKEKFNIITYKLPGGDPKHVRLPINFEPGTSLTLHWRKPTPGQAELRASMPKDHSVFVV